MSVAERRQGKGVAALRPKSPIIPIQASSDLPSQSEPVPLETTTDAGTKVTGLDLVPRLDDLDIQDFIGSGACGSVYRCCHKPTGDYYALKKVPYGLKKELRRQIVNELFALRRLSHSNIVSLFTAFSLKGYIYMVVSLVDGGSLGDYLKIRPQIPEPALGRICYLCLQGLLFLRQNHFLHRDVKPGNILISRSGDVRIADFGMARQLNQSVDLAKSYLGTMCYMAPERIRGDEYSFASDVWSFGIIFYQCALGKFPITSNDQEIQTVNFWNLLGALTTDVEVTLPPEYSDGLKDFIERCLRLDPKQRDDVKALVELPWIMKYSSDESNAELLDWVTSVDAQRQAAKSDCRGSLGEFGI